ncbi:hypothetical protein EYF80_003380 [Liparis tanakae]|uniref:Uncharacterized protein n=1 Tax=Liparis tanakae TaxID=230148 RepID=A0A4Z2J7H8_9TELE|nr:hypothetical protein EYF80_003380 [Liparis tanakae]
MIHQADGDPYPSDWELQHLLTSRDTRSSKRKTQPSAGVENKSYEMQVEGKSKVAANDGIQTEEKKAQEIKR